MNTLKVKGKVYSNPNLLINDPDLYEISITDSNIENITINCPDINYINLSNNKLKSVNIISGNNMNTIDISYNNIISFELNIKVYRFHASFNNMENLSMNIIPNVFKIHGNKLGKYAITSQGKHFSAYIDGGTVLNMENLSRLCILGETAEDLETVKKLPVHASIKFLDPVSYTMKKKEAITYLKICKVLDSMP